MLLLAFNDLQEHRSATCLSVVHQSRLMSPEQHEVAQVPSLHDISCFMNRNIHKVSPLTYIAIFASPTVSSAEAYAIGGALRVIDMKFIATEQPLFVHK